MDDREARLQRVYELTERGWQCLTHSDDINDRYVAHLAATRQLRPGVSSIDMPQAAVDALRLAADSYLEALHLVPGDDKTYLPIIHNQLGAIYSKLEVKDRAFVHLVEAIRLFEAIGNRFMAGKARENMANLHFFRGGRYHDALTQAHYALSHYAACGPDATTDAQRIHRLIAEISRVLRR